MCVGGGGCVGERWCRCVGGGGGTCVREEVNMCGWRKWCVCVW